MILFQKYYFIFNVKFNDNNNKKISLTNDTLSLKITNGTLKTEKKFKCD